MIQNVPREAAMVPSALAARAGVILPNRTSPSPHTLVPKGQVRIEDHVLCALFPGEREYRLAKLLPELHVEPLVLLVLNLG